jgi:hypothetical protein
MSQNPLKEVLPRIPSAEFVTAVAEFVTAVAEFVTAYFLQYIKK